MVDAVVENTEEKVDFTVMAIDQVIWARIYKKNIVIRVTGEDQPITITSDDGLYPFYMSQFNVHKDRQLETIAKAEALKKENEARKEMAIVED